ncbi:MAG: hypothetical protein ACE5L7_04425 [Candidatus Aminicenantales bacterium]
MGRKSIALWLMMGLFVVPQIGQEKDVWTPLKFLEGTWEGGEPGVSKVTQAYQFILGGKFLQMKTKAIFEPPEKNQEGEVHKDFGILSYDRFRKKFILRGFYVEGFVNQYVLDDVSEDGKTFTFVTEHIENAPSGTKAKLVFKVINQDEMEQSFHVAWPGKKFSCYSTNRIKKKESSERSSD